MSFLQKIVMRVLKRKRKKDQNDASIYPMF
jgi:hypothetical protein